MKVKFTDDFFAEEQTIEILKKNFGTVEVADDPDFVFCSTGNKADRLNYNCARIFITGENIIPDFNIVDYAIGFHYIDFDDRYIRIPLYNFYTEDYNIALKKHLVIKDIKKREFCNFVYSNGSSVMKERDDFYYLLSKYKKIDSGGKHLNNIGEPVIDKREFQKNYKFSIAFENSSANGYTTEKILQAFSAYTIPIYYGNPLIAKDFNTKAFINCHDYNSFDEVVEKIKEIDNSEELFEKMLKQPIFDNIENRNNPLESYEKFICNICSQDPKNAIRRCNEGWGKRIQEEAKKSNRYINIVDSNSFKAKIINALIK